MTPGTMATPRSPRSLQVASSEVFHRGEFLIKPGSLSATPPAHPECSDGAPVGSPFLMYSSTLVCHGTLERKKTEQSAIGFSVGESVQNPDIN